MYVDRKAEYHLERRCLKFLLGSEPIFCSCGRYRRKSGQSVLAFLGDLVGLGDLAGVAAGGTLSFSSTIMTTDVKGLAHFD